MYGFRRSHIVSKLMVSLANYLEPHVMPPAQRRTIRTGTPSGTYNTVHDTLELPGILPGWSCPIVKLFDW